MKLYQEKKIERMLERMRTTRENEVSAKKEGDDWEVNLFALMIAASFTFLPVVIVVLAILFLLL